MQSKRYASTTAIGALVLSAMAWPATGQEAEEKGIQATASGVVVTVAADAWAGTPNVLTEVVPLRVTIENNSRAPIRLRYSEFILAGKSARVPALPPFEIKGSETETVGALGAIDGPYPFASRGFWVAPHYSPFYRRLRPFAGAFAYDPLFYSQYYPRWVRLKLPTADMIQKALPEGVLEPGGRVTGFLYFEDVDTDADEKATFTVDLMNASTGEAMGNIRIPLEID